MPDTNDKDSINPDVEKRQQALAEVEKENAADTTGESPKPVETKSYFSSITEENEKKLKKNKIVIIVLIVALVISLGLLALGGYMYTQIAKENSDRRTQINSLERSSNSIDELKKENKKLKEDNERLSDTQEESSTAGEKMEKDLADATKKTTEQQTTIDKLTAQIKTLERNLTTNNSGSQSQSPSNTTTPNTSGSTTN